MTCRQDLGGRESKKARDTSSGTMGRRSLALRARLRPTAASGREVLATRRGATSVRPERTDRDGDHPGTYEQQLAHLAFERLEAAEGVLAFVQRRVRPIQDRHPTVVAGVDPRHQVVQRLSGALLPRSRALFVVRIEPRGLAVRAVDASPVLLRPRSLHGRHKPYRHVENACVHRVEVAEVSQELAGDESLAARRQSNH